jgi:hypothetical protein
MSYIDLALYYEKSKDIDNCNDYCEKAIRMGYSGSYPYKMLIINYVKLKDYKNALRVCNLVLKRKKIFSKQAWESICDYAVKRRQYILSKLK